MHVRPQPASRATTPCVAAVLIAASVSFIVFALTAGRSDSTTAVASSSATDMATTQPPEAAPATTASKATATAMLKSPFRRMKDAAIQHLVFHPTDREAYLTPEQRVAKPSSGWPAIVFLHGAGEVGTDLDFLHSALGATGALPQLATLTPTSAVQQPKEDPYRWTIAEVALRGYVVVAPLSDRSWGNLGNCQAVIDIVKTLPAQYGVDPSRIFITGVSQGGYGTLRIAALAPTLFAGAVPLCGFGEPAWAKAYAAAKLPLLLVHGVNDDIVGFHESEKIFKQCKAEAVPDVTLWALDPSADPLDNPGNGHAAWRNTYSDTEFWKWLSNHTRSS